MSSLINNNKAAFFLLALVLIGLLTVLAFAFVANVGGLELAGASMMRYCNGSTAACTGI